MKSRNNSIWYSLLIIPFFIFQSSTGSSGNSKLSFNHETIVSVKLPHLSSQGFHFGNGVNLQPSYFNHGHVTFGWKLMKRYPEIKTVRIEIEPSINISLAISWIKSALKNGYQVIVTYHKYKVLGSNNPQDLMDAAHWWKTNYIELSKAGYFTINLMNEWGNHHLSANNYAEAYNKAISIVRQVYNGWIILDCPGWGQETSVAEAAVKGTDGVKIIDTGIALSVHVYPNGENYAAGHPLQPSDLDILAKSGRPCIIGEFGNEPAGKANWAGIVKHAETLGWPVIGWAWNGDGGSMNMVSPSWKINARATSYSANQYFKIIDSILTNHN